jgi:hypothetical protein
MTTADSDSTRQRPILYRLVDKFSTFNTPQQNTALDEGTLSWRGHLRCTVYNPGKMTKYGILVCMACESDSGYICKLMIYDAAGMTLQNTVLELLSLYLGHGYKVYMDKYYTNVMLAKLPHE